MVTVAKETSTPEDPVAPLESIVAEVVSSLKELNEALADLNTMGHDGKLLVAHAEKIQELVTPPAEEGSNEE